MPRVKGGPVTHRRHKKILKLTKGQRGTKSTLHKRANEALLKSLSYSYRHRRERQRDFRRLWITRINAAARREGLSYSLLVHGLRKNNIGLDRKALADLAVADPKGFSQIVAQVKGGSV